MNPRHLINPYYVARRLRNARLAKGLTQKRASEASDVAKTAIEKYESVTNPRVPATRQLAALAMAYGVSTDSLLGMPS